MSNHFIIDCYTTAVNEIMRRLLKLKSTIAVENNGEYMFPGPTGLSQLSVETTNTEEQLEKWLDDTNMDYVGVCVDTNFIESKGE